MGQGIKGLTLAYIIHSCMPDEMSFLSESDKYKPELLRYLRESNKGYYERNPDVFRQERSIVIADKIDFVNDEEILRKNKADYILFITTFAIMKCNFDFYKFENRIIDIKQINFHTFKIETDVPEDIISYVQFPEPTVLRILIRVKRFYPELILDKEFSLPCIMQADTFKKNFIVANANTRSLNQIKIWESSLIV